MKIGCTAQSHLHAYIQHTRRNRTTESYVKNELYAHIKLNEQKAAMAKMSYIMYELGSEHFLSVNVSIRHHRMQTRTIPLTMYDYVCVQRCIIYKFVATTLFATRTGINLARNHYSIIRSLGESVKKIINHRFFSLSPEASVQKNGLTSIYFSSTDFFPTAVCRVLYFI